MTPQCLKKLFLFYIHKQETDSLDLILLLKNLSLLICIYLSLITTNFLLPISCVYILKLIIFIVIRFFAILNYKTESLGLGY